MAFHQVLFFQQSGGIVPVSVNIGDKVLLPEYGGTKVEMEEKASKMSPLNSPVCLSWEDLKGIVYNRDSF